MRQTITNNEDGHGGHDDKGELPAVDEGVDDGRQEDRRKEDEHPDLLANALLNRWPIVKITIILKVNFFYLVAFFVDIVLQYTVQYTIRICPKKYVVLW